MTTSTTTRRPTEGPKLIELIPAAAYVRMSTSKQEDSPERQRAQINEYAIRNGYKIIRWYQDSGMSGTESAKRSDYQQLLSDLELKAFDAVILAELSRMSREDVFDVFPQWKKFRQAGVKIVSCQRGVIDFDSIGGFISAFVDQWGAHDEVKKLANRSVTGRILKAQQGIRTSGLRLFGFDREIVDAQGNAIMVVHCSEPFKNSPNMSTNLIPSIGDGSAEAVRWAFDAIIEGKSMKSIAREFNRRGLKTMVGKPFTHCSIGKILSNETYAGITMAGVRCSGKFHRMNEHHQPFRIESHDGIISTETFDRVTAILASRANKKDTWRSYLLSGLCVCGCCGKNMGGARNEKRGHSIYRCISATCDPESCSDKASVQCYMVESAVIRAVCNIFITKAPLQNVRIKEEAKPNLEQAELKVIRQKIEKASSNLALADSPDDFKSISSVLADLRKRETTLLNSIDRQSQKLVEFKPDVAASIKNLGDNMKILERWQHISPSNRERLFPDLRIIIQATVQSIMVRYEVPQVGESKSQRIRSGVLTFNPEVTNAPPVVLTNDDLSTRERRKHLEVVEFLKDHKKPIHMNDLCAKLNLTWHNAYYRLCAAQRLGLVAMVGVKTWQYCQQ